MRSRYQRAELIDLLPQKPPFLFLESVMVEGDQAEATYRVTGEEAVGHFADRPVFPASLMIEALGQLACAWLLTRIEAERGLEARRRTQLLFVGVERIKCRRVCTPGDVLSLRIEREKVREPLAYFRGRIEVDGEKTASCEALSLSFWIPPAD
jgi:3-hydroxymyristoyl/3-hydroxydecanoyl-(acyl carrier protein) dehydratase